MAEAKLNKFGNLVCQCGSHNIDCKTVFSGIGYRSMKGMGYDYELIMFCKDCKKEYIIGYLNDKEAFSEPKDL